MARPRKTRPEKAALEKRERSGAAAMADYEAANKAEREKTARLKALRLARKPASDKTGKADHVPDSVPEEESERGPADPSRIGLKEKYEREYWKKKFGVSVQMLAEAVRVVGPSAEKVEQYLKDK